MHVDLDTQVRELLVQHRGDWAAVAKEAGVSHSWMSQFVNKRIPNPGYATLKRLFIVLTDANGVIAKRAEARRLLEAR